jgi:hypothetical protein
MLNGLLNLGEREIERITTVVLANPKVQECIENLVERIAERVSDHLFDEVIVRLDETRREG